MRKDSCSKLSYHFVIGNFGGEASLGVFVFEHESRANWVVPEDELSLAFELIPVCYFHHLNTANS